MPRDNTTLIGQGCRLKNSRELRVIDLDSFLARYELNRDMLATIWHVGGESKGEKRWSG